MEEGRERLDLVREQLVDEAVVEIEAGLVDRAPTRRDDARPRDREAKRVEAELAHQRHVVGVPVVEVAGPLARVTVPDLPGGRAEPVPDALAAAVFVRGALDLVRGRGGAPDEIGRKRAVLCRHRVLSVSSQGR